MAEQPSGFKDLLNKMMSRRWYITALVLGGFLLIIAGMFFAILSKSSIEGEWKELLLLLLGAFIGSYGKIIDYWFSDVDKDKMLVQKMDEEDGTTLSHTNDMKESDHTYAPTIPDAFVNAAIKTAEQTVVDHRVEAEAAKVEEQHKFELEKMKLEFEHHEHRQCEHVFADIDHDGDYECIKCGRIKDDHC